VLTTAFVVVVIGGLGSFEGTFISALLVGELQSFGILIFPSVSIVLLFLIMAVVLIVRPWGLLGHPEE
jgi:branched-chain amino acid transport system permease protein